MNIVIDFDGTCVTHEFPLVGKDIGAIGVLRDLVDAGHKLILFTMRCDNKKKETTHLTDAVDWVQQNNIPLYGIQSNPTQKYWTSSPKAYGDVYIDDAALGCPLIYPENGERPYVDWKIVKEILIRMGILHSEQQTTLF